MPVDPYRVVGPCLRLLPPETAHAIAIKAIQALGRGLGPRTELAADPRLAVNLWGLSFANPIGLAAGMDKNAEAADGFLGLGFGFVEVGSVTPKPQPGNPRPRLFRLKRDDALINRMGFNNDGMAAVKERLARRSGGGVVGVNLGKNKDSEDAAADYQQGARVLGPYADYLVINVSSPNTPGLRALQDRGPLVDIIRATRSGMEAASGAREVPLLLKIAPDLTAEDRRDIAEVAQQERLAGLVVSNTTISRPPGLKGGARSESGGLSGRPLLELSTETLRDMVRLTDGKLPCIGVGGVGSGRDAYAKIRAGASLVQLYTAFIYQGPGLLRRIQQELVACLQQDGFRTLGDAVGADHRSS